MGDLGPIITCVPETSHLVRSPRGKLFDVLQRQQIAGGIVSGAVILPPDRPLAPRFYPDCATVSRSDQTLDPDRIVQQLRSGALTAAAWLQTAQTLAMDALPLIPATRSSPPASPD